MKSRITKGKKVQKKRKILSENSKKTNNIPVNELEILSNRISVLKNISSAAKIGAELGYERTTWYHRLKKDSYPPKNVIDNYSIQQNIPSWHLTAPWGKSPLDPNFDFNDPNNKDLKDNSIKEVKEIYKAMTQRYANSLEYINRLQVINKALIKLLIQKNVISKDELKLLIDELKPFTSVSELTKGKL